MLTGLITEEYGLIAKYSPATIANSAKTTDIIDMSLYTQCCAILLTGDMAAETIDFKVEQSKAANMGTPADLKAATQLAADATKNDSKAVIIEWTDQDLDDDYRYVRPRAITGAGTGGLCTILVLGKTRYGKASHLASLVMETKY